MRKLTPEERLKHGVIVLLKKEDYEDLKRFAEEANTSQAAWARKLVSRGLDRARKLEAIQKQAEAQRADELAAQEAAREVEAKAAATAKKAADKAAPKRAAAAKKPTKKDVK